MEKISKDVKDAWLGSGIPGKTILAFFFIIVVTLVVFAYINIQDNIQDTRLINSLTEMIKDQKKEEALKKCVLNMWNDANNYYRNELLKFLGNYLESENIVFPPDLNDKIQAYAFKFDAIKDCLIIPEK